MGAVSVLRGGMNRNPAALLAGVYGSPVLEQKASRFKVAGGGGGVQRHDVHWIRGDGVDGGSAFNQQTGGFGLAKKTGEVQGRKAVFGAHVELSGSRGAASRMPP